MLEDRVLLTKGIGLAIAMMSGTKLDKAAQLAVSPTTIERWLAGAVEPAPARLARLARKSGVPEDVIRNGGRPVEDAA